jgi:hypothetical protein
MCKMYLRVGKMSEAVLNARHWLDAMVKRETRGAGDTVNAIRRLSNRYRIPYGLLWSLRYRPPRDLFVEMYRRIEAAYDEETRRAVTALEHERGIYEARTKIGAGLSRAADSLAREDD